MRHGRASAELSASSSHAVTTGAAVCRGLGHVLGASEVRDMGPQHKELGPVGGKGVEGRVTGPRWACPLWTTLHSCYLDEAHGKAVTCRAWCDSPGVVRMASKANSVPRGGQGAQSAASQPACGGPVEGRSSRRVPGLTLPL